MYNKDMRLSSVFYIFSLAIKLLKRSDRQSYSYEEPETIRHSISKEMRDYDLAFTQEEIENLRNALIRHHSSITFLTQEAFEVLRVQYVLEVFKKIDIPKKVSVAINNLTSQKMSFGHWAWPKGTAYPNTSVSAF